MNFSPDIAAILKSYVYVYTDPRSGKPFYVGRGKGGRLFSHLAGESETDKIATIRAIRKAGKEPRIDILRYGLTDAEAALVEAAAIDLIGLSRLTNQMSGHHDGSFGRINSQDLISMLSAKPVKVRHKAILITINQLYRSAMSPEELYDATRGIWVVGERRERAEFAMAVFQGIVREVYRIRRWLPAGTLPYRTRDTRGFKKSGRWEFEGVVATDIRDRYVGKSVGLSGQNPIRYWNV